MLALCRRLYTIPARAQTICHCLVCRSQFVRLALLSLVPPPLSLLAIYHCQHGQRFHSNALQPNESRVSRFRSNTLQPN